MKKKILIFSLAYYPKCVGGSEVAIHEITDRISPENFEFDMICLNGGSEKKFERIGNINVHKILYKINWPNKFLYPFIAFLKARKLIKTNRYDMTWSMMASYAGFAGFLLKKTNPEIKHFMTLQEGENFTRREGIFNIPYRWIFKSADYMQVISNFLVDWARKMGAKCPIDIVPNAVNFELFSNRVPEQELENLKKKFDKKPNDIFLITTGRLVKKNALEDIINVLTYLPENVRFLSLGKGELENTLKNQVKNLGLKKRVAFIDYVPYKEIPQYLQISDIFIRPSLSEGFGNSFIEAMAVGIPVIATPVGGIIDFLKDGETGLLCEVQNPRSIAQKVEKLIKDKESRDYIIRNAKEMVIEKYQWKKIAVDMQTSFTKAL